MRHRKSGRKFNRTSSSRKAMFRNMVTSLMLHGRIRTTVERAKELRSVADQVITLGKKAPLTETVEGLSGSAKQKAQAMRVSAIRRAKLWINNDDALGRVFGEYVERFKERPGGYTRVVKAGRRGGDNAAMAFIELVGKFDPSTAKKRKVSVADEVAAADASEVVEEEVVETTSAEEVAEEEAPAEEAAEEEAPAEEAAEEEAPAEEAAEEEAPAEEAAEEEAPAEEAPAKE